MATLLMICVVLLHSVFSTVTEAKGSVILLPHNAKIGTPVIRLPTTPRRVSRIVNSHESRLFRITDDHVVLKHNISSFLHTSFPLKIQHGVGLHRWYDVFKVRITDLTVTDKEKEYDGRVAEKTSVGTEETGLNLHFPKKKSTELTSDLQIVAKHRTKRQIFNYADVYAEERQSTIYRFDSSHMSFKPTYSIVSSSLPDMFRIVTEFLVVANGKVLDYEDKAQRSINVSVKVTDGDRVIERKTIFIDVLNINDEPPYFTTKPEPYLATVSVTEPENSTVFNLTADDPDGSLAKVEYFLVSGGEGRFAINKVNGEITVLKSQNFFQNKEYFLVVEAQDVYARPVQKTRTTVQILVGDRPPQIFQPVYFVHVPENAGEGYVVETIKAVSFQNFDLHYQLLDMFGDFDVPSAFNITTEGPHGGEVKLTQTLDYDDHTLPREYRLVFVVSEASNSGLSSSVRLIIQVTDVNDNYPVFRLSKYTTERGVPETIKMNTVLLNVTANDVDSGRNGELTFSVDHPLFTVDTLGNTGTIKVNGRLDYDRTNGRKYEFTVFAVDKGESPRTGSARVIVAVTNVNDEDPEFATDLEAKVFENPNVPQFVHNVQVTDPDGDNVKVYFKDASNGRSLRLGPFEITPETGGIFLTHPLQPGISHYVLNLTAEDDGLCCLSPNIRRSSEAVLIVRIVYMNPNRPSFHECRKYKENPPSVKENSEIGSHVIAVAAWDKDQGESGRVQYSLVELRTKDRFSIDSGSGLISVSGSIDREGQDGARDFRITVQARDTGSPSLSDLCSFQVHVEDENDNAPVFTSMNYRAEVSRIAAVGTSVLRLVADDADFGDNGRVEFSLIHNPDGLFNIHNETGIIYLVSKLDGLENMPIGRELIAMARDYGKPERLNSTTNVLVQILATAEKSPVWSGDILDNLPIFVNETHPIGHMNPIATLRVITRGSDNANILFINEMLQPEAKIGPFALYRQPHSRDSVDIYLQSHLDYEHMQSYDLRSAAVVSNRRNDIGFTVKVKDENDEMPEFLGLNPIALTIAGSLIENEINEQSVVNLQVIDTDRTASFRKLRYSFLPTDQISVNFSINEDTGEIKTNTWFNLEDYLPLGVIRFTVQVQDSAPSANQEVPRGQPNSATATVEVTIIDVNDNKPRFDKPFWNVSVNGDVNIGYSVLQLSATDLDRDSELEFSIVSNPNEFTVDGKTGLLKVANLLDFEKVTDGVYNLTVQVYDGKFVDTSTVLISRTIEPDQENSAMGFGLSCFECEGAVLKTEDPVLSNRVDPSLINPDCVYPNFDALNVTKCYTSEPGMVAKCNLVSTSVKSTDNAIRYIIKHSVRTCVIVPEETPDSCTEHEVSGLFSGSSWIGEKKSVNCYCSTTECNGKSALRPVSYTTLLAVVLVLGTKLSYI